MPSSNPIRLVPWPSALGKSPVFGVSRRSNLGAVLKKMITHKKGRDPIAAFASFSVPRVGYGTVPLTAPAGTLALNVNQPPSATSPPMFWLVACHTPRKSGALTSSEEATTQY
jgi:hypothetical protein